MARFLHKLLDRYLERYLRAHPQQLQPIERLERPPARFLVISSTALGDTLLSTPAIKSLRKSFPGARITFLVHRNVAPLFAGFPYVDETVLYHGGYRRFFRTVAELRRQQPEAALIFHGNGPQDIALAVLSGARFILKHPTASPQRIYLSHQFMPKRQHTIEDRLDLVRLLGGTVIDPTMEIPPLRDGNRDAAVLAGLGGAGKIVGFQVGASHPYNMWPIDNFGRLAEKILAADPEVTIVVTGVDRERPLGEKLVHACGNRVLNCCGRYGIADLPYLIRRFSLLVTGDTGPMHLAIALGVPTLSLFSAANHLGTGPYQDPTLHRVIQKDGSFVHRLPKKQRDDSAMRLISVEEVFAAYEACLHH